MRISCVIPTFNAANYLAMGLESLAMQQLPAGAELEVIVVDDGSTDDTAAIVDSFRASLTNLHYVFRPRDEYANRSRTRNLGIAAATGEIVCFLDAGVIVPAGFIRIVAARTAERPDLVLAHETWGLNIDPESEDTSMLDGFAADRLDAYMPRIKQRVHWSDPRAMSAKYIQNDLGLLPAPWTEGWSCALTVPAKLIEQAGGFDESFYGWGAEDVEFAYRLYLAGARFRFETEAYAFHYPHPITRSAAKEQSLLDNMRKMHRKHARLDTECYLPYIGLHYQAFLEKMNSIPPSSFVQAVPAMPPTGGSRLAIGFDRPEWIRSLNATHAFVFSRGVTQELSALMPNVEVRDLLGLDTPYEDGAFAVVYLSDYIRVVHPAIARMIFKEAGRIGMRTVWIHANTDRSPFPDVDPLLADRLKAISRLPARNAAAPFDQAFVPSRRRRLIMEKPYWTGMEEMRALAAQAGLTLECVPCPEAAEPSRNRRAGT